MCDLCKNKQNRNYTHSKTTLHKKLLFKLMKERVKSNYYIVKNKS